MPLPMKAIILCAGEATRLRPLSYSTAKHLLPIANKPVIEHILEAIREAGINEAGIVVSPHVEEPFKGHLRDGSSLGVSISYILQHEALGLAHAVKCTQDFVGEQPFLVYLGDNLLEHGVADMADRFRREEPNAMISLAEVDDPRRFGVAIIERGEIKRLVEKPQDPPSNLAIVGAYILDPQIFEAIQQIKPSFRGELEITDAIQWLVAHGHRVLPYRLRGWWQDVGRPEEMLEANRLLLKRLEPCIEGRLDNTEIEGPVALSAGSQVKGSRLIGPSVVGAGGQIEESVIGPYASVGSGVEVKGSEISDSIIMEGARIEGIKGLRASLVGREAEVRLAEGPSGYRLVLGDQSRIWVYEGEAVR